MSSQKLDIEGQINYDPKFVNRDLILCPQ